MRKFAIVLGAGRGERIGGPKALLEIDGMTLAERHIECALGASCERVVLVVRAEVAAIIDTSAVPEVTMVVADAPDPAGSLAVGVRVLEASAGPIDPNDRVLITPVDAVLASKEICTMLFDAVEALDAPGVRAATPTHRGRGGHPVICRFEVMAPYRSASPPPLRSVLHSLGSARARIEVDDPAVGIDLDTPEDLHRFSGTAPRFAPRVVLSPSLPLRLK